MPRLKVDNLYLDKKIHDHVLELALQSHITFNETVECLLYEHLQSSEQKASEQE